MDLLKSVLGVACLCSYSFGATLSVSVGFPSAPEAQGCSKTSTNNGSASCGASLAKSQGTALASIYEVEPNSYIVLGALHTTQPSGSTASVKSSVTVQLDQFQQLEGIRGVTLTHNCKIDCEPIQVSANGVVIGTLVGNDSYNVPNCGKPLTITLFGIENSAAPGTDYVGLFDLTAVAY